MENGIYLYQISCIIHTKNKYNKDINFLYILFRNTITLNLYDFY